MGLQQTAQLFLKEMCVQTVLLSDIKTEKIVLIWKIRKRQLATAHRYYFFKDFLKTFLTQMLLLPHWLRHNKYLNTNGKWKRNHWKHITPYLPPTHTHATITNTTTTTTINIKTNRAFKWQISGMIKAHIPIRIFNTVLSTLHLVK